MDDLVKHVGLNEIVDKIFASCEIGYLKTDKQYWDTILNKMNNYQLDEILVWDDDTDIVELAKVKGFKAELYKNSEEFFKTMAERYQII